MGDAGVFMAGEAEADEPFSVKLPCCLLQQRHPPPVVLDQVVVGGEDVGNLSLHRKYWQGVWKAGKFRKWDAIYGGTANHVAFDNLSPAIRQKEIEDEGNGCQPDSGSGRTSATRRPQASPKTFRNESISVQSCLISKDNIICLRSHA